jgi:DUF4097 and DUF4098 domain-containing protein YvlB
MNRRFLNLMLAVFSALMLAGCNFGDMQSFNKVSEDFSHQFPLAAGGTLEVYSRNGSVEVLGWEKDYVEITGTKYGRSEEDLKQIEVKITNTENSIKVNTVFNGSNRGGRGASYVIRAPHSAELVSVDTSNGSVRAEDLAKVGRLDTSNASITINRCKGPLVADTSNGSIRVSQTPGDLTLDSSNARIEADDVAGAIVADTSNGSIRATVVDPPQGADLRFDTSNASIEVTVKKYQANPMLLDSSNGSVTLRLPEDVNAELHATTSNGSIQTGFPVTVTGALKKNELKTTLGSGGPLIRVSTSNSGVRILRD